MNDCNDNRLEKYNDNLSVLLSKLPNIAPGDKEGTIVFDKNGDYTPNLYPFDDGWHLTWLHKDDGDAICDFTGVIPFKAVEKAYKFYLNMKNSTDK